MQKSDRIRLVGPTGSGKTTLLNVLDGKLSSENGAVIRHAECELLPQLKRTDTVKSGGEVTQGGMYLKPFDCSYVYKSGRRELINV
ncbi:ATP-binding cassette domain-containing protein [Halalkalibacter lacteus]|uniref:ATP-binding cassette domain-containing protein n=1 Tax=Halalkalibacter lacteus TaxID=3090663 RepID=UPI003D66F8AC